MNAGLLPQRVDCFVPSGREPVRDRVRIDQRGFTVRQWDLIFCELLSLTCPR